MTAPIERHTPAMRGRAHRGTGIIAVTQGEDVGRWNKFRDDGSSDLNVAYDDEIAQYLLVRYP